MKANRREVNKFQPQIQLVDLPSKLILALSRVLLNASLNSHSSMRIPASWPTIQQSLAATAIFICPPSKLLFGIYQEFARFKQVEGQVSAYEDQATPSKQQHSLNNAVLRRR